MNLQDIINLAISLASPLFIVWALISTAGPRNRPMTYQRSKEILKGI